MIVIPQVLTAAEAAAICLETQEMEFSDGAAGQSGFIAAIKSNDQAIHSPERDAIVAKVAKSLKANTLFVSAARPVALSPMIISRYQAGQTYGLHVDNPIMGDLRTDLSFTLFLAPKDSYAGGELVIEDGYETRMVKLGAGDMILYPSGTLHRVAPVTSGARLAVVGWVQSMIRSPAQREILFDMDRAVDITVGQGHSPLADTLIKTRANLIRMWAEVQ